MNTQQAQSDRGRTEAAKPRHRVRKTMLALVLAGCAIAAALCIVVLARALGAPPGAGKPSHGDPLPEVVVSEEQVEEGASPAEGTSQTSEDEGDAAAGDDAEAAGKESKSEAPQEPVTIRLMMVGDVLMHQALIVSGYQDDGSMSYDHLFAHITDDVQEADLAVLNQETILGGAAFPYTGYPNFNSPQEVGDAEAAAGFDVVLKATNHTFDYGYDGVRAELAYWASAHPEMAIIGMADPDGDGTAPVGGTSPAGPYVYEKDGFKVALLNYTDELNGNVDPSYDARVVSIMSEGGVRTDLAAAREQADLVVVFTHWGEEYETSPVDSERYWAQVLHEAGADVVIGGHPHVIQPVEILGEGDHRTLVCWSVGNFVSNQNGAANMVGGMVKLELVKDAEGARVGEWAFVPTVSHRQGGVGNMTAFKLGDYTDELAAGNAVTTTDGGNGGTVAWYRSFCADVLGAAFDEDSLSVHGSGL